MTPLQPSDDDRRDRHDRGGADDQDDAYSFVADELVAHRDCLVHISECVDCRTKLFNAFLRATAGAQLAEYFDEEAS